jgi:hypothetical protein
MDLAVIGAGSFGTCLAILTANAGHRVTLWCRDPATAGAIAARRENVDYLPGYALPATIEVTDDLAAAVRGRPIVLGVTPSHAIRDVLGRAAAHLDPDAIVVNASKGLEDGTLASIDDIYAEIFPPAIAARATYLSGPTFATEIAAGMPSAIVLAGRDPVSATAVQHALSNDRFRIYTSDDVAGVLIAGALKNVIAIAAGVSDGLGFGSNARAALIIPRPGRADPPRRRQGRSSPDLRRPVGHGRPGADLRRRCVAQPPGRPGAGAGPLDGRDPRGDADGRRGREDHQGRPRAGRAPRRARADHRRDARDRSPGPTSARHHESTHATRAAHRARLTLDGAGRACRRRSAPARRRCRVDRDR